MWKKKSEIEIFFFFFTYIPKFGNQICRGGSGEAPNSWKPHRSRGWYSMWRSCTSTQLGQSTASAISAPSLPLLRRPVAPACRPSCTPPMTTMPTHPTAEIVSAELLEPFRSSLFSSLCLFCFTVFEHFRRCLASFFFFFFLFFLSIFIQIYYFKYIYNLILSCIETCTTLANTSNAHNQYKILYFEIIYSTQH